ncbi:methylated-DNA--[protein]-cysteine S-methyltransferase [Thiolapillus sp.]
MTDQSPAAEYQAACHTPIGWVAVAASQDAVVKVKILESQPRLQAGRHVLADQACAVLDAWLGGGKWPRFAALEPQGTDFQRRVWKALLQISPGQTRTYGELARQLDSSPRAVGGACRSNPIPLFIPCHRVVAANGDGGFAGHTQGRWMDIKRWLIRHER